MRPPVSLAGSKIKPGQQATIQVPVARLYTHTEMTMPVHVIHGYKDGPRLFVSAAIHGDEIIGTEIIRRLMKLKKRTYFFCEKYSSKKIFYLKSRKLKH